MARRTPRTPEFDGTETTPQWGSVTKTLAAFVDAYADDPDAIDEWMDLSQAERRRIAARSLNGAVGATSFEEGVVLPVVNPRTDNLSAPGLEAAIQFAPRTDGIDGEAAQTKAEALLAEHFDREPERAREEASQHMSPTPQADAADAEFNKRVELLEKDGAEQIARGAVLVPDRLDHQGDFVRADTIADLREAFSERVADGDAYPGVMHAVFPRDDLALVEDRQLDAPETIGEKELPAGTWIQGWQYDDPLWQLVDDGVLGGFSIGGTAKGVLYEPGAMPDDVEIPDPVQADLDEAGLDRDEIMVREITDGRIMETSTVDRPAVPDAVHAETKTLAKAAPALTENVVAARLYLEARGHEPNDARRLAEYLQERKAAGSGGLVDRAKSFFGFGSGARSGTSGGGVQTAGAAAAADTPETDPRGDAQHADERAESRAGSDDGADTLTAMNEDELNDKLEALDERLEEIDAKLSDGAGEGASEETTDSGADGSGADDGPTTDEKVEELAAATTTVAEQVERVAEQVDQMASAQGVSQQADQGGTSGEAKVWGDDSPFAGGDD